MKIYFLLIVLEMSLLFWKVDRTVCKIPEIKVEISNLKVVLLYLVTIFLKTTLHIATHICRQRSDAEV